ncbi:uncharacterized protein FA14DRAFT_160437 [Meira miltonrushii]|uniref:Uncharacterized protein n=1 Tax=Meira miltonrushii TaxID=1280837 RepID=A0A316VBY7_9BASI|nr:uncharacterized protein FA14DRAFT_160437 [Meira miltonrushii]PWN35177.1 hypothetical protein FA14DRAFT_160437 [Meira miltonrushii]
MAALIPDIKSLAGSSASKPAKVPQVGEKAPQIEGINYTSSSHIIAFVRHCGCPFAEKEVRQLAEISKSHQNIRIVVVAHSDESVVQDWFKRIGEPHFDKQALESRVTVKADPNYTLFNAFGIGQLGWTQLFTRQIFGSLKSLASEGIKNTQTGHGSNRWLNSGGFAIDHGGNVRWAKVAEQAADVCNYEEAVKTVA